MAESTLSLGYSDLRQAVGHFLSFGTTIASWTATQIAIIDDIVQTGYRRVLYPLAMDAGTVGYEWSWLRPTETLATVVDEGDYDLPDDYGRIVGEFHFAPNEHRASVKIIALAALLDMRSSSDRNGCPIYAATRYKSSDGTTGQLQEVLFYPEPELDRTLYYSYDAYTGKLTDVVAYPLGGMSMSEVYKESCLAAAESHIMDEIGVHTKLYQSLLIDAIARDRKRGAQNFGQMGKGSGVSGPRRRGSRLHEGAYEISYHGEFI